MRILVAAAAAVVMLGSAGASAQSLEQTYANLCSDPEKAKSESCVVLAQALMEKLQGVAGPARTQPAPAGGSALADKSAAPPAAPSVLSTEQRWGFHLGLVGKQFIDVFVGGTVPYEYPAAIVSFAWDVPGQVLGVSQVQADGSATKIATLRWDDARGGLVETSAADGAEGLLLVPQGDGSYVAYGPSGKLRIIHRKIENETIEMLTESDLGNRWEVGWQVYRSPFTPEGLDLFRQIHANSQEVARLNASMDPKYRDPAYQRMIAERAAASKAAKAERRAERAAVFNAVVQGAAQGLGEADTGGYAEAQANLDATVANIQNAAQVERQQQVEQQRLASSAAPSASASAAATVPQASSQSAALAAPNAVIAQPVAPAQSINTSSTTRQASGQSAGNGDTQLYVFFILLGGQTAAFEGPLSLTRAESEAMEARLRNEAPEKYGAGATVDRRWRGPGACLFVYQLPGQPLYQVGSGIGAADAEMSRNGQVNNGKATLLRDVVCPGNR